MKKISFYGMVLLALSLTACTQDELQDNPLADGPVALNVTAGISQVATRVSIEGNTAAFTNGDQINVVADGNETHVYTLQGSSWSAGDNPYYFQNTGNVFFQAWYADPKLQLSANTINIDTQTQRTGSNGWNEWDILATPAVRTNVHSSTVNFTGNNAFQHVMSQVTLVFETGDGISDLSNLTGYTVKNVTTDATFNTFTCTLTQGGTIADISITGISNATGIEYTATPLILVPQPIAGAIGLEVTYNNQTYKAELTAPTNGLQPGSSYTYNVTISNTGLTVGNAEISGWTSQTPINGDATLQ